MTHRGFWRDSQEVLWGTHRVVSWVPKDKMCVKVRIIYITQRTSKKKKKVSDLIYNFQSVGVKGCQDKIYFFFASKIFARTGCKAEGGSQRARTHLSHFLSKKTKILQVAFLPHISCGISVPCYGAPANFPKPSKVLLLLLSKFAKYRTLHNTYTLREFL